MSSTVPERPADASSRAKRAVSGTFYSVNEDHIPPLSVPDAWCACMGTLSPKQALKDLADEAVELAKEPSRDELSDVVFAVGRLLGSLINKPLVALPGSRLHVEKISHRMQHHGCVRSVRHLQDGVCPSSPK
jgi:hypothetical protein